MGKTPKTDRKQERRSTSKNRSEKPPEQGISIKGSAEKVKRNTRINFQRYLELKKEEQKNLLEKQKLLKEIKNYFKAQYEQLNLEGNEENDTHQNKKFRFTLKLLKDHSAVRAFYRKHLHYL